MVVRHEDLASMVFADDSPRVPAWGVRRMFVGQKLDRFHSAWSIT